MFERRSWWLYLLWLVWPLGLAAQIETRHIHVLKLLDNENHDYTIREGCRSINYGISKEIGLISAELGIDQVLEYDLTGPGFNLERLDQVLEYEMEYQERDIVVLVYVGHGFREPGSQTALPSLYFGSYSESVELVELQERILDKRPSLLLSVVVACNVTVENYGVPPPYVPVNTAPEVVTLATGSRRNDAYRQLFADQSDYTKCIDLVSADQEYFTFISTDGGIFFNEILYALQEALSGRVYPTWEELCRTVTERTVQRSQYKGLQQQPLSRYYLRFNPVEVSVSPTGGLLSRQSPCKLRLQELRRSQRQDLRNLRRSHRLASRDSKQHQSPPAERRLLAQQQRVDMEQLKLRHQRDYVRQMQNCH